jgi:S-adenosylmethionine-diacylgycerolhomoserine-N-methlytransferase
VARQRIAEKKWENVEAVEADATVFQPPGGPVDVVTFSYSLTMIPDWFAAIDQAWRLLKPGGHVGVVDFFVSRKHPETGRAHHPWFTRTFWPTWFAQDNVFLSPDHLPYLSNRFLPERLAERQSRVPYLPLRVPYYVFVGRKPL